MKIFINLIVQLLLLIPFIVIFLGITFSENGPIPLTLAQGIYLCFLILYFISIILAVFLHNSSFFTWLPYCLVGLLAIYIFVGKQIDDAHIRKSTYQSYSPSTASKDFVCSPDRFISYDQPNQTFIEIDQKRNSLNIVADVDQVNKTITPKTKSLNLSLSEFTSNYSDCKNTNGKAIFDIYSFSPNPVNQDYIGMFITLKGITVSTNLGAGINSYTIFPILTNVPILLDTPKEWPTNLLGEQVIVTGTLVNTKETLTISGRTDMKSNYELKNSTWKILPAN